jgi:hypothetical protein
MGKMNLTKFWEELIAYFPWYDTGHIENHASNNSYIVACVFVAAVTFLPSRCLAMIGGFLPSRCLATIRVFLAGRCLATMGFFPETPSNDKGVFTDPLPSNDKGIFTERLTSNNKGDTQTRTHTHRQQRDLISLL